jgi:hypothetical protein
MVLNVYPNRQVALDELLEPEFFFSVLGAGVAAGLESLEAGLAEGAASLLAAALYLSLR